MVLLISRLCLTPDTSAAMMDHNGAVSENHFRRIHQIHTENTLFVSALSLHLNPQEKKKLCLCPRADIWLEHSVCRKVRGQLKCCETVIGQLRACPLFEPYCLDVAGTDQGSHSGARGCSSGQCMGTMRVWPDTLDKPQSALGFIPKDPQHLRREQLIPVSLRICLLY